MLENNQNASTPPENYSKSIRKNYSNKSNVSNIIAHQKQADSLANFKIWYAISFALQLGFLIAVAIGGFMFLGLAGDKYFHTAPFLLIAGIVLGIIITGYEVYHLLGFLIRKND